MPAIDLREPWLSFLQDPEREDLTLDLWIEIIDELGGVRP